MFVNSNNKKPFKTLKNCFHIYFLFLKPLFVLFSPSLLRLMFSDSISCDWILMLFFIFETFSVQNNNKNKFLALNNNKANLLHFLYYFVFLLAFAYKN